MRLLFLAGMCLVIGIIHAEELNITMTEETKHVIVNDYTTDYSFHNGMLAVRNDETGRWGFVDEAGNLAVGFNWEYETFGYPKFGKDAALLFKTDPKNRYNKQWYIVNRHGGAIRITAKLVGHTPFNDSGYAIVVKSAGGMFSRAVYIDSRGREVFPSIAQSVVTLSPNIPDECRPFRDGLAAYYDVSKRLWGFINQAGRIVVPAIYNAVQDFSDGMAAVQMRDGGLRWGFINTTGRLVIPTKFSNQPCPFYEGYASVEKRDGSVVMIDKTGAVVSPEYDDIRNFFLGYAFAKPKGKSWVDVVDENFNVVKPQVVGLRLYNYQRDGRPLEFINGYCNWEQGIGVYIMTNAIGRVLSFRSKFGDNIDVMHRTENVIHCRIGNIDGYINYKGHFVFIFTEEEF